MPLLAVELLRAGEWLAASQTMCPPWLPPRDHTWAFEKEERRIQANIQSIGMCDRKSAHRPSDRKTQELCYRIQ